MKKKFLLNLLASAVLVSSIAGLAACQNSTPSADGGNGSNNQNGGTVSAMSVRDVYAMSALSGVSYLTQEAPLSAQTASVRAARYAAAEATPNVGATLSARPTYVTDEDVNGIESCIATFDNILLGGGIEQSVQENDSTDPRFSNYALKMTISTPLETGALADYALYFNELNKTTQTEVDDGKKETEERTTFEGILLFGEEPFVVKGVKEVETEGKETETSLEFRTYPTVEAEGILADENNFVVISQEVEKGEISFEYSFYENGRKIQEIELEYEENRKGVELSFQIKDISSGKRQETEYELKKRENGFIVEFEKNDKKDYILITKNADGYTFTYSNGFEESVK